MRFTQWLAGWFGASTNQVMWPLTDEDSIADLGCRRLGYLTLLFLNSHLLWDSYSAGAIAAGLAAISNPCMGDEALLMTRASLPWQRRRICIGSQVALFEHVFARKSTSFDREHWTDLEWAGFMWWENILPDEKGQALEWTAFIDVMCAVLEQPSAVCQWSALHGLGHARVFSPEPERCVAQLDAFRVGHLMLQDDFLQYLNEARDGVVQ
jgi:hypothetical protein